jgi:hypothetical protein
MNGDGISELAISSLLAQRFYVVLGGSIEKGTVNIDKLIGEGRGFVIENCPYRQIAPRDYMTFYGVKIGDVNGDEFADMAVVGVWEMDSEGNMRSCIAFVLGREVFPQSLSYTDMPKFYGKLHSVRSKFLQVHGVGDIDGDGFDDLAFVVVTSPPLEHGDDPRSIEYALLFGRRFFEHETTYEEEMERGDACGFLEYREGVSVLIGPVGDQDGDARDDIGVYSINNTTRLYPESGRFRVLSGGTREKLCRLRNIDNDGDFDVTFQASDGYNGEIREIGGGRDIDRDGKPDILLADRHEDRWAQEPSRAIVIFGGDLEQKAGPLSQVKESFELVNYRSNVVLEGESFPTRFEFAGDVNGDTYEDLVVHDRNRLYLYYNPLGRVDSDSLFIRGDANQDAMVNIADAVYILQHMFLHGPPIVCLDAADSNDDEKLNVADAVYILQNLFANGPALPPPSECGPDPAGMDLDCRDGVCL